MKLRRFVAKDMKTALAQVRATFGPDAVIVSNHSVPAGVEVVAAMDYDAAIDAQTITNRHKKPVVEAIPSNVQWETDPHIETMQQQINDLKSMLSTQLASFAWQDMQKRNPVAQVMFKHLTQLGLSTELADSIITTLPEHLSLADAWKSVIDALKQTLVIADCEIMASEGIYAFVGPTGVGKTTTIAKIAARFVLRHGAHNLGLITTDNYRIAAHEQLRTYGKILGVNVHSATNQQELDNALIKLKDKQLVLIDSAGLSYQDERLNNQLHSFDNAVDDIKKCLVLSCNMHPSLIKQVFKTYNNYTVSQCILTKMDETTSLGGIINCLAQFDIPLSYIANGQRVPEDLVPARAEWLVDKAIELAELFDDLQSEELLAYRHARRETHAS